MFKIKPDFDTVSKTIRLPEHMVAELEKLAKENNLSFTALVTQCLQYALDSMSADAEE